MMMMDGVEFGKWMEGERDILSPGINVMDESLEDLERMLSDSSLRLHEKLFIAGALHARICIHAATNGMV